MGKPSPEQRRTLGTFLASKRARIQPDGAGLSGSVRRTPGLRREEVAALAGVSVSWYTWIEQGRDIQVSVETLRRVARALRLDHVETTHLLALALHVPLDPTAPEQPSEGLDMLLQAMGPVPAYVRNARFDILAWNKAVTELFLDYGALQPHERNTIRLMFLYTPYRTLIQNWESLAHGYVSTLRAARTRAIDKAPFDRLVAELSEASAEFRAWWAENEVTAFDEGRKRLRHPFLGDVEYTYLSMTPDRHPSLSVVVYLPHKAARNLPS